MKTVRFLSYFAGLALTLAGCVGAEGPQGPPGNDGTNGVANITITVYDVYYPNWAATSNYFTAATTDGAIADFNANQVTASFSATSGTGPWQALPANNVFVNGDQITYSWTQGLISFFYDYTSLASMPNEVFFNVTVIPQAVAKKYPNVNFKDANAVAQLPEWQAAMKVAKHVSVQAAPASTTQAAH